MPVVFCGQFVKREGHSVVGIMANPLIDKSLRMAKERVVSSMAPHALALDIGGPIAVRIDPVGHLPCSAAFYDLESETLSLHVLPFDPYYSFLELGDARIDTDECGRPVFVEVSGAQKDWIIDRELKMPKPCEEGTLVFRQTRRRFAAPKIIADNHRETVCLKFLARRGDRMVRVAENLLAETADGFLVALWFSAVRLDFAEREQSRWRSRVAARLRKEGCQWRCCSGRKVSESLSRVTNT